MIRLRNNCALFLPTSCFWCSLGYGIPGVHAVYDTEPVHGLDSEPEQEVSDQTSAVGADSSLYSSCCKRSHHSGMLDRSRMMEKAVCFLKFFGMIFFLISKKSNSVSIIFIDPIDLCDYTCSQKCGFCIRNKVKTNMEKGIFMFLPFKYI